MQKYNTIRGKFGSVVVIIEGFFVERFINLCKINNIEIWNIKNINGANVEFEIEIFNYKKLKDICKKTKCKMKIKNKKGLYFLMHRYRKRKIFFAAIICSFCIIIYLSTLVWKIEITGLEKVSRKELINTLKEANVYVGKCRLFIEPQVAVKYVRANIPDIVWITINLRGTNIEVKLKERGEVVSVEDHTPTHIIAKKTGIITKVVAENGTRIVDKNNYIEKGDIAICGILENIKTGYVALVKAKGILRANVEYEEEFQVDKIEIKKNFDGKEYIFLGINLNNQEFALNYLIKSKKYDITKSEYSMDLWNFHLGLNVFFAKSYNEEKIEHTKKEQEEILTEKINKRIEEVTSKDTLFISKKIDFIEEKNKMIAKVKYILNEDILEEKTFSNMEE